MNARAEAAGGPRAGKAPRENDTPRAEGGTAGEERAGEAPREVPGWQSRTARVLGARSAALLAGRRVAVFGLGGVGSYAVETLARAGIGAFDLVDGDTISETNLNRQLFALRSTIGRFKTDAAKERILDINPAARVFTHTLFWREGADGAAQGADGEAGDAPRAESGATRGERDAEARRAGEVPLDFSAIDYIVDAQDTISAKADLAALAEERGIPIISAMGAGNKTNPAALEIADIFDTSACPVARAVRSALRGRGVRRLKVVYSKEPPVRPACGGSEEPRGTTGRRTPGSTPFVPAAAGILMASEVVKDLLSAAGGAAGK